MKQIKAFLNENNIKIDKETSNIYFELINTDYIQIMKITANEYFVQFSNTKPNRKFISDEEAIQFIKQNLLSGILKDIDNNNEAIAKEDELAEKGAEYDC